MLVIWGDDIRNWNITFNNRDMMGYATPNNISVSRLTGLLIVYLYWLPM